MSKGGDQAPANALEQIATFKVGIFLGRERHGDAGQDNHRADDLLWRHGGAEPEIFSDRRHGHGHAMDDQGGEPGAEQGKGAEQCDIAQTESNGAAQQKKSKDLRMPVTHQRGAERQRN